MHVQPGIAASKKQWSINPKFYKTMRFALDFSLRTHLDITHFLKMQWLPVDVGVEQLNLNIMRRIVHGGAPCHLTESFGMVSQVHDVETRHITLSVSLPSTGRNGSKAFTLNGIKSWNKLPENKEIKLNVTF